MLHVGATNIRLTRAAKPKRKDHTGKRVAPEPGEAIEARLIITVAKDSEETTIARWSLISNVAAEIDATGLPTWYYWRWSIDCYFKLLKQAGRDTEPRLHTP